MKRLLVVFTCVVLISKLKAQVVFCPPGAEWHYTFGTINYIANETIKYVRDSIIGSDTLKVLSHTRSYLNCNSSRPSLTLIKQKGDTIFFKNNITQQTWQILYNFAAQAGQGWQTTYNTTYHTSVVTETCTVSSVSSITLNNTNLKRISLGSDYITERFGSNKFLFMFYNTRSCDGDQIAGFLCYKDDTFGLYQFTNLSCDYFWSIYSGLPLYNEINFIKLFPNPASNTLNLSFENKNEGNYEIRFVNILGKEILPKQNSKSENENLVFDLSIVEHGIYFVQVFEKNELIATKKIVKK